MNVGILLKIIKEAVMKLESMGLINADGTFNVPTPEQDAELALYVEQELKGYGVAVPDKVVKVTEILPLILSMVK